MWQYYKHTHNRFNACLSPTFWITSAKSRFFISSNGEFAKEATIQATTIRIYCHQQELELNQDKLRQVQTNDVIRRQTKSWWNFTLILTIIFDPEKWELTNKNPDGERTNPILHCDTQPRAWFIEVSLPVWICLEVDAEVDGPIPPLLRIDAACKQYTEAGGLKAWVRCVQWKTNTQRFSFMSYIQSRPNDCYMFTN